VTLVDSSGWIEFFTDGPQASRYAPYLKEPSEVLTPTIVLYEVYKIVKRERTEEDALVCVAQMQKTGVLPLTERVALDAADLSLEHGLAMTDAIVYATARAHDAALVTSDADLKDLPGVTYHAKRPR